MATTLVVVPVYGQWDYALDTVTSLYRAADASFYDSCQSVECVVYDDASPDYKPEYEAAIRAVDPRVTFHRFEKNAGMTRSWNAGLSLARERAIPFTCLANSDLLFTPNWDRYLRDAAASHALAGPVSNAPGHTTKHQDVARYKPDYVLSDEWKDLVATADQLRASHPTTVIRARVNGFCMMAGTELAWKYPFDKDNVLDPSCPMAGNEDRLQDRWERVGMTFAVVPASFVFHYRSVTRGDRYKKGRWMRRGPQPQRRSEL